MFSDATIYGMFDEKNAGTNEGVLELEVRFGEFNKKFIPGLQKNVFDRLKSFVSSFAKYEKTEYSCIINFSNNTRRVYILADPEQGHKFSYPWNVSCIKDEYLQEKINVCKNYDVNEFGVRFSLANERVIPEYNTNNIDMFVTIRKRMIYSFLGNEFHFGMFKTDNKLIEEHTFESLPLNYNFEMEMGGDKPNIGLVYEFIKVIQDTKYPIGVSEMKNVLYNYTLFSGKKKFIGIQPETASIGKIANGNYSIAGGSIAVTRDYSITLKLNGTRQLIYLLGGRIYSINSKVEITFLGLTFNDPTLDNIVLDSEYFKSKFYIFDIIINEGVDLRKDSTFTLTKRLELLTKVIDRVTKSAKIGTDFFIKKEYFFTNSLYSTAVNALKNAQESDIDGIIFNAVDGPLSAIPMKWKPVDQLTIDFKIKKTISTTDSVVWNLYCYDSGKEVLFAYNAVKELIPNSLTEFEQYKNIHLCIVDKNTDKKFRDNTVIEFKFDAKKLVFIPIRSRPDKIRGNHISIAVDNFENILFPFNLEYLKSLPQFGIEQASGHLSIYTINIKRYDNYIKNKVINIYCKKTHSLLDLCCGDASDVGKWILNNIKYVEGYDKNKHLIDIANERKRIIESEPQTKNFQFVFKQCVLGEQSELCLSEKTHDVITLFDSVECFSEPQFRSLISHTKHLKRNGLFIMTLIVPPQIESVSKNWSDDVPRVRNNTFNIKGGNSSPGLTMNGFSDGSIPLDITFDTNYSFDSNWVVGNMTMKVRGSNSITQDIVNKQTVIHLLESIGLDLITETSSNEFYNDWCENNNVLNIFEKVYSFSKTILVFQKTRVGDEIVAQKTQRFASLLNEPQAPKIPSEMAVFQRSKIHKENLREKIPIQKRERAPPKPRIGTPTRKENIILSKKLDDWNTDVKNDMSKKVVPNKTSKLFRDRDRSQTNTKNKPDNTIEDTLSKKTVSDLKALCDKLSIVKIGKKTEIIERITAHIQETGKCIDAFKTDE